MNILLSWILSNQDLHMIAFLGLKISILFLCRVTYSILAHFYLVYLSLKSPTLISFQLCLHSYTSYLHRYSSYCGSVSTVVHQVKLSASPSSANVTASIAPDISTLSRNGLIAAANEALRVPRSLEH